MGRPLQKVDGNKYGMLTVLETYRKDRRTFVKCLCDCGNETDVRFDSVCSYGETVSCGCYARSTQSGEHARSFRHGKSHTPIYRHWDAIKKRCNNPNYESFHRYGGRGITICEEWENDFSAFEEWALASGWKKGLTIDRIDYNGNYEPDNCRWATSKQQGNNKSTNVMTEVRGETLTLTQLAEKYNLIPSTVMGRYRKGKRGEELIEPPKIIRRRRGNSSDCDKVDEHRRA